MKKTAFCSLILLCIPAIAFSQATPRENPYNAIELEFQTLLKQAQSLQEQKETFQSQINSILTQRRILYAYVNLTRDDTQYPDNGYAWTFPMGSEYPVGGAGVQLLLCARKVQPAPKQVCIPNSTAPCYSGPSATRQIGNCRDGIITCNQDGTAWGPCVGAVLPTPEVLDGKDNDCDGYIDNAFIQNGYPCSANSQCVSGKCYNSVCTP